MAIGFEGHVFMFVDLWLRNLWFREFVVLVFVVICGN